MGRSQRRKVLTQGVASNGTTIEDLVPGGGDGGTGEPGPGTPLTGLNPTEASIANFSEPGTIVATLAPVGGTGPFTFVMTANPAAFSLEVVTNTLVTQYQPVSPAGELTQPVTIEVTDSASQTFTGDVVVTVTQAGS